MIVEVTNKLFPVSNYSTPSNLNDGHVINANDSDILMLKRLKKQSHKNLRFSDGKNKQEDARLRLIHNILEKNYDYEDNNWYKEVIQIKKSIGDIKISTTQYSNPSTPTSSYSSFKTSSKQESRLTRLSSRARSSKSPTDFTLNSQISEYEYVKYGPKSSTSKSREGERNEEENVNRVINAPKRYIINHFDNTSRRLSAKFFKNVNQMNQNETIQLKSALRKEHLNNIYDKDESDNDLDDFFADDSFEDTCDPSNFSKGDRSSLKSRSIYTNHTGDLNKKCNLFPCGFLRSYTSMTGPEKDKKKEDLEYICLKHDFNEKVSRAQTAATYKTGYSNKSDKELAAQESIDKAFSSDYQNENLIRNKSIRRPLRKTDSVNDVLHKVKSLKNKVEYCRKENEVNLKADDRNVRYGDSLPKKKIYRQLRILSQFENIIK